VLCASINKLLRLDFLLNISSLARTFNIPVPEIPNSDIHLEFGYEWYKVEQPAVEDIAAVREKLMSGESFTMKPSEYGLAHNLECLY
jgi:hypothetical protein